MSLGGVFIFGILFASLKVGLKFFKAVKNGVVMGS